MMERNIGKSLIQQLKDLNQLCNPQGNTYQQSNLIIKQPPLGFGKCIPTYAQQELKCSKRKEEQKKFIPKDISIEEHNPSKQQHQIK